MSELVKSESDQLEIEQFIVPEEILVKTEPQAEQTVVKTSTEELTHDIRSIKAEPLEIECDFEATYDYVLDQKPLSLTGSSEIKQELSRDSEETPSLVRAEVLATDESHDILNQGIQEEKDTLQAPVLHCAAETDEYGDSVLSDKVNLLLDPQQRQRTTHRSHAERSSKLREELKTLNRRIVAAKERQALAIQAIAESVEKRTAVYEKLLELKRRQLHIDEKKTNSEERKTSAEVRKTDVVVVSKRNVEDEGEELFQLKRRRLDIDEKNNSEERKTSAEVRKTDVVEVSKRNVEDQDMVIVVAMMAAMVGVLFSM